MWKLLTWFMGGGAEIVTGTIKSVGQNVTDVKVANVRAATDTHKIDATADVEKARIGAAVDTRQVELQSTLALQENATGKTSWMRQVGVAIAYFYLSCVVLKFAIPKLAALLWIEATSLPDIWAYVVVGILGSIFLFRPWEKKKLNENVTKVQENVIVAQSSKPVVSSLWQNRQ